MSLETQVSMITGMIKWILDKAIPIMVIIALAFALYWFWGWLKKGKLKGLIEKFKGKPKQPQSYWDVYKQQNLIGGKENGK